MSYDYKDQGTDQKEKSGMTVLVVEPLKKPYLKTISGSLRSLQKEVGGLIDATYPFEDPVAVVLNDTGKLRGLMPNRGLYNNNGNLYDVIAGTFLVTGLTEDSFCSLSKEMAEKYMEKYKVPEIMIRINGQLGMLPLPEEWKGRTIQIDKEPKNEKNQEKKSGKRSRTDEER